MKIKFGFCKWEKGKDDIYLLPALAIGLAENKKMKAWGIGIKLFKITFSIGFIFNKIPAAESAINADSEN